MRKITSLILVFCLLLTGIFGENVPAFASTKETYSKTIAIVFDNIITVAIKSDKVIAMQIIDVIILRLDNI